MPTQNPYSDKLHGALKEAYGDSFSLTEEQFLEKMNSDVAYRDKIYGAFQEAYGDGFTLTPEQFSEKLKKKGVSGQGSDPLTQNLPVKTVPAKVAPKGQATNVKPAPQKQAPAGMQGDPFANQQVPASVGYDARLVRESIKGVKEGLDKTYRIAQEGKRKNYFSSWNTQEAYSYIKPSVDYTEQMLDKIKNIQDPEIQALYTELKNANTQMKDMVGQAWNDGWDESSVNQYIGGLNRQISTKLDEVDRRMAQLQQPTEQEKKTQETFQKAKLAPSKKEALPAKTEQQIKEEKELAAMPKTVGLPTEEELKAREEESTYPEKREQLKAAFEATPWLKSTYGDFENFELSNDVKEAVEKGEDVAALFNEKAAQKSIKAQAEVLEATMGQRHKDVNFSAYQENFNQLYDAWNKSWSEDPESEESKTLSKDLREAESAMNEAYKNLDLDYLESMKATQPTLATENIDRYNKISQRVAAGEEVGDSEMQFLYDTRKQALTAYGVMENAKLMKLKENVDIPGYTKMMAEITPLFQEVLGQQDLVKYASEQQMKQAKATMAPIQEEYGKKRRELSDYESQLKDIDAQLAQLDAEYQLGMKTQQEYEYGFNQLSSARNNVYGLYSTTYSALEELNKAMETAIAPFNTEVSKIQDPYNKKIAELNQAIADIKKKTGVDDSVLAQLDIAYKNLATVDLGIKTTNAQFSKQNYSEELNKMLEKQRKEDGSIVGEMVRGFTSGMANIVLGAMKLPKGIGLEDSDEYGFVDKLYYDAMQLQKEASGTWGGLTGDDVPFWLDQAYGIANGVASTYTYAMGGAIPISSLVTSAATTFVLSAGDNYQRAIDAGFDTGEAQIFSNLMTLAQAGAEMIYNDVNVFDDVVGNTILRNVTKNGLTLKQAAKVAFQQLPKNAAKTSKAIKMELLEEGTALFTEKLVLNTTNTMAGKKYFEDATLSTKEVQDTFITTSGSTFITRMIGRRSKLDPNSRMALFKSVENSQKALENAERNNLDKSKIAEIKKTLDEAKLKLSVVENHTNWSRMTDEQKAYAFDVARQLELNEKAVKSNAQNGIQDESLNQQTEELRQELNDSLNNPEAVQQQEQAKSNTLEVLEAIKNGEDYTQMVSQHPNWNSLSDAEKKEIESLSEDLEEKQREILSLFEVGVESSSTIEQRDAIEGKIAEILNNPIKLVQNDQKDVQGVSGEVGEGKEPVAAEPVEVPGTETPEAGGVLQAPEQEEVTPTTEVTTPSTETVTRISEVAPSVRRAGAVEASEGSNQNAGEESALEGVGMDDASLNEWKKANKAPSKKGRIEELAQAVRDLMSGKIKFKDYYQRAKQLMPSKPMDKVPTPATNEEIVGSVDRNKLGIGIINLNKFVKQGMKVGLRIDIPAFNNFGKNVVTVHDRSGSGQPVIGYGSTGSIKNVNFRTSVTTASKIAAGESKSAFAMAQGEWMDESPESIQARAEEALNSPEWVQVGMNPTRNSFFFDKADGNPVVSADEVLQVGNLVLAKNPKKIDLNTTEGMAEFEKMFSAKSAEGVTYQFREGEGTTTTAPEADAETEEVSPEIAKIEEQRAAELEAFENDENLTDIDGEQVLLTPDGRITSDTINKKYDKRVNFQKEIEAAVAEVKKQQNPEYQAALREAINADPQATTEVHQMAAENILNGAKAADAIATAKQEATQKARAEKARQAMEREGLVSTEEDIDKSIENVSRALRSTGIRVKLIKDPAKFEEERKKAKASDTAEAWFRSKTGEIVLSLPALKAGWGSTIVFHEGTHPIINIIRNTNKPLYDKVIKGLRDAAKKEKLNGKPNPLKDVEAWVQKAAGNKTQEQQDDEFITETIARLASGDIEIKRLPLTLRDKLIEFLNKMAKFMGFKRVFLNSPDYEFRRLANQIATTLAKGERIEKVVGKRNVKKYDVSFEQNTVGTPTSIVQPSNLNRAPKVKVNPKGHKLSFVKPSDIKDISALIKQIADKNQKVWFWVADQLGRGLYFDSVIDGYHFLDAGPSFALDPENRSKNVIWATGKNQKEIEKLMAQADYIFIISGSPQQSKLFNKKISEIVFNRIEKAIIDEAAGEKIDPFKKFKDGILSVSKVSSLNKILDSVNSFDELLNSPKRKPFLIDMLDQQSKQTPLKKLFEKYNAFVDLNEFRDGFYADNNFELNDIMLVLKPTGFGGTSKHSTYENDVLGEVVGVPDRKINAYDIMTDDFKAKYGEMPRTQQQQTVAPYGIGVRSVQASEKVGRGARGKENLVEGTYYQSGLTEDKNDYVFFHVSSAPEASIRKGIDSTKYTSLRTAREEKGLQYGVASYYTRPEDGERMVGGEKYAVRVPKNKVYPIDSDPNGYSEQAEANIPEGTPFRSEAVKREIADMAKKDGYQMIVGEWSYSRTGKPAGELPEFRADALVPLKPTKEKPDSFTSNADKGMERIPFPGQQSEEAKQELESIASEVRDIMSSKKKFSSKEYALADSVYMSGQVTENKYEDNEFKRDITPEEYDMMTKVLPKSMQAEAARVRKLLFPAETKQKNERISKALGIEDTIQPSGMGRGERATGYRGLPGKYVEDYNGIQYFAENEKYAGVFGKNIVKANISKNKILDLAKWNKKLKDAGIPDNGMGQPFLTIDQSMFDENRNFTTKGREGTFGKMKRAIGLDEFNKFKEEFDNAEVIYGEDAGNVGEMVYAVRDPKAIDLTGEETIQPSEKVGRGERTREVKLSNSPKGTYLNIGLVEGMTDRLIPMEEVLANLPSDVKVLESKAVFGTEPTVSVKISRKLTDAEMDKLLLDTKQMAIPQLSDGGGVIHGTKDWGDFNPEYFIMPNGNKLSDTSELIQPSLPGRFDKNDIPDLIQRSIAGIDADLNKGMSLLEAIENNVTSQDWYPLLSDKEKRQFQSVIESAFEDEVAGLPSEQEEAAEIGVDPNTRQVTSELEDLYYETRDGNRRQRNQAESRRNEIFRGNPKLSYIYKNFDLLSAQLEERGLLTKSIGCP